MHTSEGVYLYRRNNGRYYIGKRREGKVVWRSTRATTKGEALKALRVEQVELDRLTSSTPLKTFSERFLSTISETHADRTIQIYVRSLERLQRIIGDKGLEHLTGEHWARYRSERMKGVAAVTVNQELRALRAVMNAAVRWGYVSVSPFAREKFVPVPEVLPVYFTQSEFLRLLDQVDVPVYREVFLFAALTGCRREEVISLRWGDYDEKRSMITIQSSQGFTTKTRKIRSLPLHPTLVQMLRCRPEGERSGYIFTQQGKRLQGNNVTRRLRFHAREAGLRKGLHFHSLRHSFASWLIQAGESLYVVQKLLGHTSSRMTQIYSHLEGNNLQKSVERISL